METDNFIPENGRKLKSVEKNFKILKTRVGGKKRQNVFIQCLVFNKTIIPLTLCWGLCAPHLVRYLKEDPYLYPELQSVIA